MNFQSPSPLFRLFLGFLPTFPTIVLFNHSNTVNFAIFALC